MSESVRILTQAERDRGHRLLGLLDAEIAAMHGGKALGARLEKSMAIRPDDWVWYGNAAHFIGAQDCKFHLATTVGQWIISTVGEYQPNSKQSEPLGCGDELYETFVFAWQDKQVCDCGCGLPRADNFNEISSERWLTPGEANQGHRDACAKAARNPKEWLDILDEQVKLSEELDIYDT